MVLDLCIFLSWFRRDDIFDWRKQYLVFLQTHFLLPKTLIDGLERWITCGLLWCLYQLFGLSFWRHPFTSEAPLVSKWWNAKFLHSMKKNRLIYILDGLRVSTFQQIFIFGWTIPLRLLYILRCVSLSVSYALTAGLFQYWQGRLQTQ